MARPCGETALQLPSRKTPGGEKKPAQTTPEERQFHELKGETRSARLRTPGSHRANHAGARVKAAKISARQGKHSRAAELSRSTAGIRQGEAPPASEQGIKGIKGHARASLGSFLSSLIQMFPAGSRDFSGQSRQRFGTNRGAFPRELFRAGSGMILGGRMDLR
jgi:hypothetical protein